MAGWVAVMSHIEQPPYTHSTAQHTPTDALFGVCSCFVTRPTPCVMVAHTEDAQQTGMLSAAVAMCVCGFACVA